jgi:hypothetical protein
MKTIFENVGILFVFLIRIILGVVLGVVTLIAEIILAIFVAPIVAIDAMYMNGSEFMDVYPDVIVNLFEVVNKPFFAFVKEETES